MQQIRIGNITVDVVRKDIKNMHLAVYPPTGRVRIAAPRLTKDEAIRLFAVSKIGWIKRHQRNFQKQERLSPREYKERESHYFQGRRYLLRVKDTNGAGYVDLKGKTYLDLYVKPGSTEPYKRDILDAWYRENLKQILPKMVGHWEEKLGVQVAFCGIKKMKTKWGSCNIERRRIWLNLELAKKPIQCLEYILVHEMVHLLERHHNDRFTAILERNLPNWRQLKEELNRIPVSHADWDY